MAGSDSKSIIACTLKLQLRPAQERMLTRWLWHITAVYNWTIRKIELDAARGIYHSRYDLGAMVAGHGQKIGIPARMLEGAVLTAHDAWKRCFKRISKRPRLKGKRNRLNSLSCRQIIARPVGSRIYLMGVGPVRFHKQDVPEGRIKRTQIIRRASGWYLCLFIESEPRAIQFTGDSEVGIDPGFSSLLTLSTGEKVDRPNELAATAQRLSQAQRGKNRRLTARLKEREGNQRKDRNHKLSRRLVAENSAIYWSDDNYQSLARTFGKSVASAAPGQLRQMLVYKSSSCRRTFVEVSNRYSTVTCSACGARSGPTGYAGLRVRQWRCGCGAEHDRDVNAAVNTLLAGRGLRLDAEITTEATQ